MGNNNDGTIALLEKYFDIAFAAPDGVKKLRELILSLAMQGKLVPQDINDQPASELLKEIEQEKQRLIKEEGLKTSANEHIEDNEQYFGTPQGWKYYRLGNLARFIDYRGKTPKKVNSGIPLITAKNVRFGYINREPYEYLTESEYESWMTRGFPRVGDILFTTEAPLGNVAIIDIQERFALAQRVICLQLHKPEMACFLKFLIMSVMFQNHLLDNATGMTATGIKASRLKEIPVPIPPLAEQRRIVAKIDELMARCDELEKLRSDRDRKQITVHNSALNRLLIAKEQSDFNTSWQFITQHFSELYSVKENVTELRKAILQLAVMGKLVPQDLNDQPASELLKEIEKEKQRLIKEGKIKKSKPLPEIKPDEIPYKIPASWQWVRFFTINVVKSELVSAKDYPLEKQIAPDSIEKGSGRLLYHRTVEESGAKGPNNRFYKNQILYSKIRPSLNKAVIAPYGGLCSADMYPIETFVDINFMLKSILSEMFLEQVRQAENRVKMPKLNLESLGIFYIPLPPLAEQHRIVTKIDQLMTICDNLEKQIDNANSKQTNLLNAVITKI